mmetsp:Transcript_15340/g.23095  ORF Transcript_15340/g.23095 Transcript_15340/m.23095 type:complete len:1139 (-) Transcript_15340:103-3519(-)
MMVVTVMLSMCLLASIITPLPAQDPSIVMTMLIRDEEDNIHNNLHQWVHLMDYFVFLIDDRTSDKSVQNIAAVLDGKRPYNIQFHSFSGFGSARTKLFSIAWQYYSDAAFVFMAQPSWIPDLSTINKRELMTTHDVYRFTVYDSESSTTFSVNWLLRHKNGLAMRYNANEVLDIGENYSETFTNWTVRTPKSRRLGKSSSYVSLERWNDKIRYIEEDIVQYGSNPYFHYHLGRSHIRYIEAMRDCTGNTMTSIISEHLNNSVSNLTQCAMTAARSQFREEKYYAILTLGKVYADYLEDKVTALKWFQYCHEFEPYQTECGFRIASFYESEGFVDDSFTVLEGILRRERKQLTISNDLQHSSCAVPAITARVFIDVEKYSTKKFTPGDAKYVQLMVLMMKDGHCTTDEKLALPVPHDITAIMTKYGVPRESNTLSLCDDEEVKTYLLKKMYLYHPCANIDSKIQHKKLCRDFNVFQPSPSEDRQVAHLGEYIGAASIVDIVHHVYGGFAGYVTNNPHNRQLYRVLFAEYFHVRSVLQLIAFSDSIGISHVVKITVLTSDPKMKATIENILDSCSSELNSRPEITFVDLQNNELFRDALKDVDGSEFNYFDYVEYNAGMSLSAHYENHLKDLHMMIGLHGVIGASLFTKNFVQEKLHELIRNRRNISRSSDDTDFIVRGFLRVNYLKGFVQDEGLIRSLGNPNLQAFSKSEVLSKLKFLGFRVVSWVPTARMNPYDMIQDDRVQRYELYGMSEDEYLETVTTHFRAAVYISRADSRIHGRANLMNDNEIQNDAIIVDRDGSLGKMFFSAADRARNRYPLSVSIPLTLREKSDHVLQFLCRPEFMGALSLLSNSPTFGYMIDFNSKITSHLSVPALRAHMIKALRVFTSFNFVTMWTPGMPTDSDSYLVSTVIKTVESAPQLLVQPQQYLNQLSFSRDMEANTRTVSTTHFGLSPNDAKSMPLTGARKSNTDSANGLSVTFSVEKGQRQEDIFTPGRMKSCREGDLPIMGDTCGSELLNNPIERSHSDILPKATNEFSSPPVALLKRMGYSDEMIQKLANKEKVELEGDQPINSILNRDEAYITRKFSVQEETKLGSPLSKDNQKQALNKNSERGSMPGFCSISGLAGSKLCQKLAQESNT